MVGRAVPCPPSKRGAGTAPPTIRENPWLKPFKSLQFHCSTSTIFLPDNMRHGGRLRRCLRQPTLRSKASSAHLAPYQNLPILPSSTAKIRENPCKSVVKIATQSLCVPLCVKTFANFALNKAGRRDCAPYQNLPISTAK